jgi:hypothetical protein
MYQLHQYTAQKWDTKSSEHPSYALKIEEHLKIARSINHSYSIGVFSKQQEEHDAAVKKFTRARKDFDALKSKYDAATKEREAASALVTAGSHNPEIALKNFVAMVGAEASQNAFACELAAQEGVVNAAASAVVRRDHGADSLVRKDNRLRYLHTLISPSEHYNLPGGGSVTIPLGESPVQYLKALAHADGSMLTSAEQAWLPFGEELLRLEFSRMLSDQKREIKDFQPGGPFFAAAKLRPYSATESDLEHVFAARREGYAAARAKKAQQLEALQAEMLKQA